MIQAAPADAAKLSARYQKVDPKILQLLEKDGVTVSVVRPGQSFTATGVLPARSLADYQSEMGKMQATAKRVEAATAPYARGIARLQQNGGDSSQLQRERRMALLDSLPQDSLAVPYSIPSLAGLIRDSDGLHKLAQLQKLPKGTTLMAQLVGAKTPTQIQEYTQLVESINGTRLEQARQAALATATPAQQAAWSKDPGQIPLDLKGYDILVPDLAYVADGSGGSVRVNLLDASIHGAWADGNGKTVSNSSINGQYFSQSRKILVQSSRIGTPTSVHELGHAVEDAVSRHDPKFFGSWHSKLFTAYQRAAQSGTVSEYATSNVGEYIAEGVSHYYENPEVLRQKDSKLFELTQQLLERAGQLLQ
ncbi:hypothetical protein ABS71_10730 [bacterium SCN 62-11]|nr:MAG: hypothetical protein ABS71_10730 [bacterium SCN 62-11]